MLLNTGVQLLVGQGSPAQASTNTHEFNIQSDGVLISLNVISVTGTVNVSVYSIVGVDTLLLHQFTAIVAPTTDPVQWQSPTIGSALRAIVTTSGPAQYELFARASGATVTLEEPIDVVVTNTVAVTLDEPIAVTLDEPIAVTLDEPIAVTLDEPIAVTLDEPIDVTVIAAAAIPGPSQYTQKLITVGTVAVELFTGVSRNPNRQVISIYNDGSGTVFIGPLGVTAAGAAKGRQLSASQFTSFEMGNAALYAIAGSGTRNLIVEEWAP